MNVRDFMTLDPVTIPVDAPLAEAWRRMETHDVRHLPVVRGPELVGILSDRDLIEATTEEFESQRVEDRLHTPALIGPDDSAVAAALELSLRRVGCLPVVEQGTLLGILSEYDVLELYSRVCRSTGLDSVEDPPVSDCASTPVQCAESNEAVGQVRDRMVSKGFRHMPVQQDGKLVGIISDRDLRRASSVENWSDRPVADFMTRSVESIGPEQSMSTAAAQLSEQKIGALIVETPEGELVGILSLADVLDHSLGSLREPNPG